MKKRLNITINKLNPSELSKLKSDCIVLGINSDKKLNKYANELNKITNGSIKKLQNKEYIKGNIGNSGYLAAPHGVKSDIVYLIGTGKNKENISMEKAMSILSNMINSILKSKAVNASIVLPEIIVDGQDKNWLIQQLAYLAENNRYTYDAKIN